jgi:small redox-active disulfide protein 2
MEIKVLGSGCSKCEKLEAIVKEIVAEKNIDATVIKVDDFKEILSFGVMKTPALVINGKVAFSGSIPKKSKIESYLK